MREEITVGRSKYFEACRYCENRTETCHSECERYAAEVILGIILDGEAKKAAQHRNDEYAICERRAVRVSNARKSAKKAMRLNRFMRKRGR